MLVPISVAALLTGCDGVPGPGPPRTIPGSFVTVTVADNSFSPSNLTITGGTAVTWAWAGKNEHSVTGTWDGAPLGSPRQRDGAFTFRFGRAGTFEYQCGVHGAAMSGKVTVK